MAVKLAAMMPTRKSVTVARGRGASSWPKTKKAIRSWPNRRTDYATAKCRNQYKIEESQRYSPLITVGFLSCCQRSRPGRTLFGAVVSLIGSRHYSLH